jgi:hypothetical protein
LKKSFYASFVESWLQFFLYTAGLAFSSLKEWELALSLYKYGLISQLACD